MKTRIFYWALLVSGLLCNGCKKHDFAAGRLSPIIALSDLRPIYKGSAVKLTKDNMMGATQITGLIISDPDSGNSPRNVLVLQNIRRAQIRGISLPLGEAASTFRSGDSLLVNVEGKTLTRIGGALQITGLTLADIKKISSGNMVTVQAASSYSIKTNPDAYENTLVQIKTAIVSPAPADTDTFAGDRYLVNGADSVLMHTETTASYAKQKLPASATVAGILFARSDSTGASYQIWPRTGADITDRTQPTDPSDLGKFPVIITGYANDVKGSDGNYEYFQFRATRTIDFSKTPMAVVTCTNAGSAAPDAGNAPSGGWAEGGRRTYKFNLTSGVVNKGDFFYVGGTGKRIDGANTTDISAANWIRSITYTTTDGDGFGSASSGLLPNSGNAGGIAIFAGINVTESSVPVDFVLYGGTGKTTIFNATSNTGYRVVDNDHYQTVDTATNTPQPFVYEGTNTYVIPHSTPADAGIFVELGGAFDAASKTWTTPRGHTFVQLSATSQLPDIEQGENVTTIQ